MSEFSVSRMRIVCPDDCDKAFAAKHEEGLGDVWYAILGDNDDIVLHIENIISKGTNNKDFSSNLDGKNVVLIQYPDQASIIAGGLLVNENTGNNFELYSCYPIFEGITNSLTILKTHTWENGVEGTVAARS